MTIETPKGGRGWKLSTIYVSPAHRGAGIGGQLVAKCERVWARQGVRENVVTVREGREEDLLRLLEPAGFKQIDRQVDRYGRGKTEIILRRQQGQRCLEVC